MTSIFCPAQTYENLFVALQFQIAKTTLLLHVIERVILILRGEQVQIVAGVDVRFVARADLARDHCGVAAGVGFYVAAGDEFSGFLDGVVVFFVDAFLAVLAVGFDVVFVAGRYWRRQ